MRAGEGAEEDRRAGSWVGRVWVVGGLRVGGGWVAGGWRMALGDVRPWQIKEAMPAAERKKDFASEGFLGPERSGEPLSFARQRSEIF